MLAHQSLSLRQSLAESCNSEIIVFDAQNDRVAGLYVKSTPKRSRDNNPPVFVNASMALYRRHDILYIMSFSKSVSSEERMTCSPISAQQGYRAYPSSRSSISRGQFKLALHNPHDPPMRLHRRPACIHRHDALRLPCGNC